MQTQFVLPLASVVLGLLGASCGKTDSGINPPTDGATESVPQDATYDGTDAGSMTPSCSGMLSGLNALFSDPLLTACVVDSYCLVVGGPSSWSPCGLASTIGDCGKSVNAAVYNAGSGPAVEFAFWQDCPNYLGTYDCGPGYAGCSAGICVITRFGCCGCVGDGGR